MVDSSSAFSCLWIQDRVVLIVTPKERISCSVTDEDKIMQLLQTPMVYIFQSTSDFVFQCLVKPQGLHWLDGWRWENHQKKRLKRLFPIGYFKHIKSNHLWLEAGYPNIHPLLKRLWNSSHVIWHGFMPLEQGYRLWKHVKTYEPCLEEAVIVRVTTGGAIEQWFFQKGHLIHYLSWPEGSFRDWSQVAQEISRGLYAIEKTHAMDLKSPIFIDNQNQEPISAFAFLDWSAQHLMALDSPAVNPWDGGPLVLFPSNRTALLHWIMPWHSAPSWVLSLILIGLLAIVLFLMQSIGVLQEDLRTKRDNLYQIQQREKKIEKNLLESPLSVQITEKLLEFYKIEESSCNVFWFFLEKFTKVLEDEYTIQKYAIQEGLLRVEIVFSGPHGLQGASRFQPFLERWKKHFPSIPFRFMQDALKQADSFPSGASMYEINQQTLLLILPVSSFSPLFLHHAHNPENG